MSDAMKIFNRGAKGKQRMQTEVGSVKERSNSSIRLPLLERLWVQTPLIFGEARSHQFQNQVPSFLGRRFKAEMEMES
jgi:hypothetical protein